MCSHGEEEAFEGDLDIPPAEYQARVQEQAARELKRKHQLLSKVLEEVERKDKEKKGAREWMEKLRER